MVLTTSVACAGKPMTLHGSYGREYATGRGVVLATRELLRNEHMGKIAGKTFVIQVQAPLSFTSLLLASEVCHSLMMKMQSYLLPLGEPRCSEGATATETKSQDTKVNKSSQPLAYLMPRAVRRYLAGYDCFAFTSSARWTLQQ